MSRHIHLRLCDPKESQAEFKIACALEDMINGYMLPIYAAEIVDESIRADLEECYEECKAIRNPTPKQLENGMIRWPNPSPLMHLLWMGIALVAMRLPADHQGQDQVVEFLQELSRLPPHKVPRVVGYSTEIEFGCLWTNDSLVAFKSWMVEVDRTKFTSRIEVGKNSESAQRYVNFSAFLARLFAAGVIDALESSALIRPSPIAIRERFTPSSQPTSDDYEPCSSAAAQWILHAGESIFSLCSKEILLEASNKQFSMALWDSWKLKFGAVSNADGFSTGGREWANSALKKMQVIEKGRVVDRSVSICEVTALSYGELREKQAIEVAMG